MKRASGWLFVFAVPWGQILADTPPPQPRLQSTCSSSGRYCAISDPEKGVTRIATGFSEPTLWSIPGWHPLLLVSNDGESVVVVFDGENLVPLKVTLREPVLSFWRRGKLIRQVRLGDLYQDKSQLSRTLGHFSWLNDIELNSANQVVIKLVTGRTVAFSAATGLREEIALHGT